MDFYVFHQYRRLVRRKLAEPLTCERCKQELALTKSVEGEPVLICFTCDYRLNPGLKLYNRIYAIVKEHYL